MVKNLAWRKVFDTSKIRSDDPLREQKIKLIEDVEYEFGHLKTYDKYSRERKGEVLMDGLWTSKRSVEKVVPLAIKQYVKEGSLYSSIENPDNFENNWVERIRDAKTLSQAKRISLEAKYAVDRWGRNLKEAMELLFEEVYPIWGNKILIENTYLGEEAKWIEVLKRKLAQFDKFVVTPQRDGAKVSVKFQGKHEWLKENAIKMLREELLAQIADCEKSIEESKVGSESWKKVQKQRNENGLRMFLTDLEKCEFVWINTNNSVMVKKRSYHAWPTTLGSFRRELERDINDLNDEYLPSGQKKADLLKKLEEVIEKGVREVNNSVSHTSPTNDNNTSDSASETSDNESVNDTPATSIFGGEEEEETNAWLTDNNSVGSENKEDNKESTSEAEGGLEWCRKVAIKQITEKLNEEPIIKEGDLEAENRDWLAQIQKEEVKSKVMDILRRVKADIRNKREVKKQSAELDNIIENIPALFEGQSSNNQENIIKTLQTINQSLGEGENEAKAEQAKEKMIENNSEIYFDSVIKWAREEKVKLEEERKNLEEENKSETSSVIEYDEEEQQFLNGEITDKKKKKEIVKRIEKKIHVKKKSWNLWKWLREWYNWLKTKAQLLKKKNKVDLENKIKQIEQELKNMENSSNPLTRQAYQENQQQAEKLLSELNTISQDSNQTETTGNNNNKSLLRKEVVIPAVIGGAILLTAVILIIVRKSKVIKKKKQR